MKKRLCCIVLALLLLAGLLPAGALAADTGVSTWTQLQSALQDGGSIRLDADIAAAVGDSELTVPENATVTLDLNGHSIDLTMTDTEYEIDYGGSIALFGKLTVRDGSGAQNGCITGGRVGIYAFGSAELTLSSGRISGNRDPLNNSGTGVQIEQRASFTMNGGEISGNAAGEHGGGVYCAAGSEEVYNAKLLLTDSPVVTDNTVPGGAENVYHSHISYTDYHDQTYDQSCVIDVTGPLGAGVLSGHDAGIPDPQADATRAEVVRLVMNFDLTRKGGIV